MLNCFVLLAITLASVSATTDKIICYYSNRAVYRPGDGKFSVEDISPHLCTHMIYSSIGIKDDGSLNILDPWSDIELGGLRKFKELKIKNKNLKTLVAIGGWNEDSETYSTVISDDTLRATFVDNTVKFLLEHDFDGCDLDWEYPAQRDGVVIDKINFSKLVAELREAFSPFHFILSAAIPATLTAIETSYEISVLSKHLDFINVMAYNLHGIDDGKTGQNAPLYPSSMDDTPSEKARNVDRCVKDLIKNGADPSKLNLGVAAYGRSFTLKDPNNFKLGAPILGAGLPGPYTRKAGMLEYNEICEGWKTGRWKVAWDEEQKVPFAYSGNQWVSYDDARSAEIKADYAKLMKLGGLVVWDIDTDDFRGSCGRAYPILKAINRSLQSKTGISINSYPVSEQEFECTDEGYFRDPFDCSKFYYCHRTGKDYFQSELRCPGGLYFDKKNYACRDPSEVSC